MRLSEKNQRSLPKGWVKATLEQISIVILGQSPPSSSYNKEGKGLPFFQGKTDFGKLHPTARVWCDSPKKIAKKSDILISVRAPVGSTNISKETCCIGRGLSAIRVIEVAEMLYVFHQLRYLENHISQKGTGTTFKAITGTQLKSVQISLPPLPEQKRIVAKLESIFVQIDAAKEKLLALQSGIQSGHASLATLKSSVLKQAFEGKLVSQNPNDESAEILLRKICKDSEITFDKDNLPPGWITFRFGSCLVLNYGKSQTKINRKTGKIPVYGSSGITGHHNKALILTPCLIVGRKGSAGNVFYVNEPCWPLDTTYFIDKFPTHDAKFLFWLFCHMRLHNLDTSTTIPSLRRDDVYSLQVIMPPLPEQKRIVAKLESIFTKIDAKQKEIERLELMLKSVPESINMIKGGVLKLAFEGKLVPQDPNDEPASVLLKRIQSQKSQKT